MRKLKITFNSPVVLLFVLGCFLAMILNYVTFGKSNQAFFMTYHSPLKNPMTWVRLFTHVLGHSGWVHFIGNMSYILLLGPMLEEKYGSFKILEVILATAFVTGLVHYLFFRNEGLCGASGVVFAFILLTSFTSFRDGELPVTVILVALIYIGQQVYEGLFLRDDVSNLSHIIGGLVGAVIGYHMNRTRD